MIKLLALQKRRADLSFAEFRRYYEHEHANLFIRSIPAEVAEAIRYYAQNYAAQLDGTEHQPPYDCVTEFGFDDIQGMRLWTSWYLSDAGQQLRTDEERFMDASLRVVIVTEEHRIPHR